MVSFMAALAGASQRYVQTKDQEREERLITEKLDREERLLDKRLKQERDLAKDEEKLRLQIAKLQYDPKFQQSEDLPKFIQDYNTQKPNYSTLFSYDQAKNLQFIPSSMSEYDFYKVGAGGHTFNIPFNRNTPVGSGKAILNTTSGNRNVYSTVLAVASADSATLKELGYSEAAKLDAINILGVMNANLSNSMNKQYYEEAQKDTDENVQYFNQTWRTFTGNDWTGLDSVVQKELTRLIPESIGLSKSYYEDFLPQLKQDEKVFVGSDLGVEILNTTGRDGNNKSFNIDEPDELIDKTLIQLMNKYGTYRGLRDEDHFNIVKKELLSAVGDGVKKKEIAQIPFNVAAVLEKEATVGPDGMILINNPDMMKVALTGTTVPINQWKVHRPDDDIKTTQEMTINPAVFTGSKFGSFTNLVNVAAAGLDEVYIPEKSKAFLDPDVQVTQVSNKLRTKYGIDTKKLAERNQAVTELLGITRSMQMFLAGVTVKEGKGDQVATIVAETGLREKITSLRSGFGEMIKNYLGEIGDDKSAYGLGVDLLLGTGGEVTDQATVNQMMQFMTHVLVYNLARTLENPQGDGARLSQSDVEKLASMLGFEKLFPTPRGQKSTLQLIEARAEYEQQYNNIMLTSNDPNKLMMAHTLRNQVFTDNNFMVPKGLSYSTAGTDLMRAFENITNFLPGIAPSSKGLTPS